MINKEKAENIIKDQLFEDIKKGRIIKNYIDNGKSIHCDSYNKNGSINIHHQEYEDLYKDDICECWDDGDPDDEKELFYFEKYLKGKPKFKRYKKDKTLLYFDNYRIVERAK